MAPLDSHDGFDAAPPFQVEPIRLQAPIFKDMPSYSRPMKIHVPNKSMFASIFAGHTSGGGVFGRNLGGQKSNGIYKSSVVLLPAAYEPRMGTVPTKWSKQMSNWFGVFRTSQFWVAIAVCLFEVEADMCLIEKSLKMPRVKALQIFWSGFSNKSSLMFTIPDTQSMEYGIFTKIYHKI